MPSQDLIDYIKKELKRGVDLNRIKEKLLLVGHAEFHVNEAIEKVNKKKNKLNYAILFMSLTIFLVIVILSYNLFISQIETEIDIPGPSTDLQTFSRAINQNDLNLCNDIEDENLKQNCLNYEPSEPSPDLQIFSRAINQNDPLICDQILNERIKYNCRNYFR